jgi:hypothetical protein
MLQLKYDQIRKIQKRCCPEPMTGPVVGGAAAVAAATPANESISG